jgi:hypothetical protein
MRSRARALLPSACPAVAVGARTLRAPEEDSVGDCQGPSDRC